MGGLKLPAAELRGLRSLCILQRAQERDLMGKTTSRVAGRTWGKEGFGENKLNHIRESKERRERTADLDSEGEIVKQSHAE